MGAFVRFRLVLMSYQFGAFVLGFGAYVRLRLIFVCVLFLER